MQTKRIVSIGRVKAGGKNPVRIKAMLKTPTVNVQGLIDETKALVACGAEAIRMAVLTESDSRLVQRIKSRVDVPMVADIHFHYKLALAAIESGFDCIRLNPQNISKKSQVREVARLAKAKGVSIRVGINSGGFRKDFSGPQAMAKAMVAKCQQYIQILEAEKFFDIMVSLKGADVPTTIFANRLFDKQSAYPLHLGVTATGSLLQGVTKSAVGLGVLLEQGIGQLIRVSLTGPSIEEVKVAQYILGALGKRQFGHEVISCPTCSRCEVDLAAIVETFKKKIEGLQCGKFLRVAIMGCVVNGPGEAYQADIGVAFGKQKAVIFKKDKILKHSNEANVVKDLLGEVEKIWT